MPTLLPDMRLRALHVLLSPATWRTLLCGALLLGRRPVTAQSSATSATSASGARILSAYRGHQVPPFPTNWIIDSEQALRDMPGWVVLEGRNRTGRFVATAKRTGNRADSAGLALEDVILLPGRGRETPLVTGRCGRVTATGVIADERLVAVARKERRTIWRRLVAAWRIDSETGRVRSIRLEGLACTADDWTPAGDMPNPAR